MVKKSFRGSQDAKHEPRYIVHHSTAELPAKKSPALERLPAFIHSACIPRSQGHSWCSWVRMYSMRTYRMNKCIVHLQVMYGVITATFLVSEFAGI